MNTPNPLVPQGSLEEQSKGKSHIRIAVITILAIHVVLLGALLIQGCKPEPVPPPKPPLTDPTNVVAETNTTPPATNIVAPTNPVVAPTNVTVIPTNPVPEVVAGATTHTVVNRDSFYTLGKKYGVSMKAVELANPGVDSSKLKIGQKLNIPAKTAPAPTPPTGVAPTADAGADGLYVVKSGDTLGKIAKANGTTAKAIQAANNLKTTRIAVGQKLKLPARTTPVPAAATPPATPTTPAATPAPIP